MSRIGAVTITSDQLDGEADTMDDFTAIDQRSLETISFRAERTGSWQQLLVTIDRTVASLYRVGDEPVIAGVVVSLEQLLRSRERRVINQLADWVGWVALSVGSIGVVTGGTLLTAKDPIERPGMAALIVGVVLCGLGGLALIMGKRCTGEILLEPREARPGWFARNRDSLVVEIGGGVIVLVIGILIGRWLN